MPACMNWRTSESPSPSRGAAPVEDLCAVKACPHDIGVFRSEQPDHVSLDLRGRGSGKCGYGDTGELGAKKPQGPVVGPELVSPFRDAVRFIHGNQRQTVARQRRRKAGMDSRSGET